jgi:hypothetical protein
VYWGMVRDVVVEIAWRVVRVYLGLGICERWRVTRERRFMWLFLLSQLRISEEKMMLYKVAWELHIYWGMLTSLQLRR